MAAVPEPAILFVDNILNNVESVTPEDDDSPRFVIVPCQDEVLDSQDITCVSNSEVESNWVILDDESVVKDSSPTVVEILVEADPNTTSDRTELDDSKPIEITDESVVTVNGKTCVLRTNPETGSLYAYPSKRKPGRPPKCVRNLAESSPQSDPSKLNLVIAPDSLSTVNVPNSGQPIANKKRKRGRMKTQKPESNPNPPLISVKKPDSQDPWLESWKCGLCGHQSLYAQQSQDHLRTFHGDVVHKCQICHFVCVPENDLVEHYTSTHPKNYCHYCGLTSDKAYIVKRHMMRHTMEASCDLCGKVFKDKYILKTHKKMVHMTEKTNFYECQVRGCGKKFTRSNHLTRHMLIHDDQRNFKCPHCSYCGIEKADVTKHMTVHDEPRFTCEICKKLFRQSKNLDLHMKRHNQQRDYKCGICDFLGYTFTDIRKHIERAHKERSLLYCEKCESVFKSLNDCIEHYTSGPCEPTLLDCVETETETDSVIIQSDSTGDGKKETRTWNQGENTEEPIINDDLYLEVEDTGQPLSDEHWSRVVQSLDGYTTVDVHSTATSHSPDNQHVDVEPADEG